MKFQFLPENFSRSENAPPFETRKIRQFEVERIFLENKKMVHHLILKGYFGCFLLESPKSLSTNKLILIAPCAILSSRKNNGGKHGNDKAENMGNNG